MMRAITVNNKPYGLGQGTIEYNFPLIECLDTIGNSIPNFCYHKYLSIAGNCRMCVIESLNALKPLISCVANINSYISNKIFTKGPLTLKARENIVEFLLLNHPIDCTVCDQAGECDLQDHTVIYGSPDSRFNSYKRGTDDKEAGPTIKTSMTRCIHCTRCVRFCAEISGFKELGIFNRGVFSEVGLYKLDNKIKTELSGNLIDLCPVSSLSKKSQNGVFFILKRNFHDFNGPRYKDVNWELVKKEEIINFIKHISITGDLSLMRRYEQKVFIYLNFLKAIYKLSTILGSKPLNKIENTITDPTTEKIDVTTYKQASNYLYYRVLPRETNTLIFLMKKKKRMKDPFRFKCFKLEKDLLEKFNIDLKKLKIDIRNPRF